ncbi:MAG: DegT/DnrJ/EryC1/StrS family aminotransferase [Smithella sp.]
MVETATRKEYLPFGKPNFSEEEIAAVTRVMRSGWVGMGPETILFEKELAEYTGAPHIVTVDSCTSALFLSLLVQGINANDEVVCPSLTWCSTANAILYLGATPVFCDIDPETLCTTTEHILSKVTSRTKAVIVVHYGGLTVNVAELRLALPNNIAIIEDAAHAFGSFYHGGKRVGSSENLTCFSFYANKNLCTAEGGAIALFDELVAERLASLRQHALPINAWKRFSHANTIILSNQLSRLGYKMNYTDLQAAIGRIQLARQSGFAEIRLKIAHCYYDNLKDFSPAITCQRDCCGPHHARHLFVIQLPLEKIKKGRNEILLELRAKNIGASIHYAPLHLMPLYNGKKQPPSLPVTENVAEKIITLPISASMNESDAQYVIAHLLKIISH